MNGTLLPLASTMAYNENFLNLTNGYYKVNTSSEGDQFEYLVPFPPGFTSTMKAYWTTDVIVFDPSCSWQTPTAGLVNLSWDVTLAESNLSVTVSNSSFGMFLLSSHVFMSVFTRFQYRDLPRSQFPCARTQVRNSLFLWTVPYFLS
jgi:hypothetical protein